MAAISSVAHADSNSLYQDTHPIMGILAQPNRHSWTNVCPSSYVQTTYVDFLAAAGVRSVVIRYDDPNLAAKLSKVQGALFTGGGLDLQLETQFVSAARTIFDYATNNPGFVLWGTCQGFQIVSILAAQDFSVLTCGFEGTEPSMLPLDLQPAWKQSRFFERISNNSQYVAASLLDDFTKENSTINLHHCGVAPAMFTSNKNLAVNFTTLSTNKDINGKPFVSFFEATNNNLQIYASQFHPEAYYWDGLGIANKLAPSTIRVSQYASSFIAEKLRKCTNRYTDDRWKKDLLIQSNFPIVDQDADEVTGFFCVGALPESDAVRERRRGDTFEALWAATLVVLIGTSLGLCYLCKKHRGAADESAGASAKQGYGAVQV